MSRIGKTPIHIPKGVKIDFKNSKVKVQGEFGILEMMIPTSISLDKKNEILEIKTLNNSRKNRSLHGLYRTLISNTVFGVAKQFQKILLLKGTGYRAIVQKNTLILHLGYSHTIKIDIPTDIFIEIIKNTTIKLKSVNKEKLGLFAANIRAWRKPEPYNGKGILYENETIIRKVGKVGK